MTPQEMIDVIQAHKDGKQIQYQIHDWKNTRWEDVTIHPCWDFGRTNFRIKPKTPKTMHEYLLCNTSNNKYISTSAFYSSMEDALKDYKNSYWTIVKRLDYTEITITE